MAQFGKYFTYNGKSSEAFDMIVAGFQIQGIPLNMKRNTTSSALNRYRHRTTMYGIVYDSVLTFTMQLMKDPCKYTNLEDLRFSRQEIREISAWLTSPISPRLFHMTDFPRTKEVVTPTEVEVEDIEVVIDPETGEETTRTVTRTEIHNIVQEVDVSEEEYDYFGVFTDISSSDNFIYVIECTFECNTPYALSSEQSVKITNGSGIVPNPSDEYEDFVYPIIIITPTDSEQMDGYDIRLVNESDGNNSVTLKNMKYQDPVTIDCRKLTVKNKSGSLISFEDLDIDVRDYIYWFRLVHGDNNIAVYGGATVEFIYRYPVKVGAY